MNCEVYRAVLSAQIQLNPARQSFMLQMDNDPKQTVKNNPRGKEIGDSSVAESVIWNRVFSAVCGITWTDTELFIYDYLIHLFNSSLQ